MLPSLIAFSICFALFLSALFVNGFFLHNFTYRKSCSTESVKPKRQYEIYKISHMHTDTVTYIYSHNGAHTTRARQIKTMLERSL